METCRAGTPPTHQRMAREPAEGRSGPRRSCRDAGEPKLDCLPEREPAAGVRGNPPDPSSGGGLHPPGAAESLGPLGDRPAVAEDAGMELVPYQVPRRRERPREGRALADPPELREPSARHPRAKEPSQGTEKSKRGPPPSPAARGLVVQQSFSI